MARVSVVIPTFNGLHHLQECLPALRAQTLRDHEVIVVDNGSTDGTLDWLRDLGVSVIDLERNRGFAAAVNAGILASDAPLIALLNNDTRPEPEWLEHLVAGLQRDAGAAMAASLLVRWDDPDVVDAAGDLYSLWRGAGMSRGAGHRRDHYRGPGHVFGACAAAALYRTELFEQIGMFDEDFFLLHEDTDISLRANVAGWRCVYVPDAVVAHRRGASTHLDAAVTAMSLRNRIWAAARSLPSGLWLAWWACFALRLVLLRVQRPHRTCVPNPHPVSVRDASSRRARREQREQRQQRQQHEHPERQTPPTPWTALVQAIRQVPAKRREGKPNRKLGTLRMMWRLR